MKKVMVIGAFAIGIMAAMAAPAMAAPASDGPAAECDGVKIATGPKGKGYSALYADIVKVCGGKVTICERNTTGGLDNLNALSTKEADMGLVQIDTWGDMKGGDENIAGLQAIMQMNNNYLHIVASVSGFAALMNSSALIRS